MGHAQEVLTDATFDVVEELEAFAAERDISLLDVAIGGLARSRRSAGHRRSHLGRAGRGPTPRQVDGNRQDEELVEINRLTSTGLTT